MLIVHVYEFGIDDIVVDEVPDAEPAAGQLLVSAEAATINPVDIGIVTGDLSSVFPAGARKPYTPGWDLCGRVVAAGAGADESLVGTRVVGFSPWMNTGMGTQAGLVALPSQNLSAAPDGLSSTSLTTLGLNGLTAWRAVEEVNPVAGETVVVTGAAGSVGGFAVALAIARGAKVIAAASERDRDALLAQGAFAVVAREEGDLGDAVRRLVPDGADALLDTASLAAAALGAVRDGGRFVTVTNVPESERGVIVGRIVGVANAPALATMLSMAKSGKILTPVAKEFPVRDARAAYREFVSGSHRGRIVLTF